MNIVEPILFQARFQPAAPALCAQGIDLVSYSELVARMNQVARRAMSLGLRSGNIVALSINDQLLHATVILGLTQIGIVPVSVAGNKPPDGLKVDAVIRNIDYPFVPQVRHLMLDHSWTSGAISPVDVSPSGADAKDKICRIILTSGSTGDPKAVALTHELATARIARTNFLFGNRISTHSRIYMNMGLASARGFYFLMRVLGHGGTIFFRGESVENTLRSFEIFKIESMHATPTSLVRLLADLDRHPSIDVHIDTVVSGGSALTAQLVERVRPRLCTYLVNNYGATETNVTATALAHRIAHIPGAVGYLTPGARAEIVDESDRPVPVGTEGIVRLANECAVDRYIDDPIESAQVFRDGWFYPGEVGSLGPDNLLIISGRQSHVLNAGGGKIAAEKLEEVLTSFEGVNEAAAFVQVNALGVHEVVVGIVCSRSIDLGRLRLYCQSRLPAEFVPAHVVALDGLPATPNGKVDRVRVKELVAATART